MRKKILLLGLGICLLFTACAEKKSKEKADQPDTNQQKEETSQETEKSTETESGTKTEAESSEEENATDLTQVPEVTFTDYSQEIADEESGVHLLSVAENSPVVSIPENEAAAEKINMTFEQLHIQNQTNIEEDTKLAKDAYKELSDSEKESWNGYGYGSTHKAVYVSTRILSIEQESYQWQGGAHPNTWTSSYCFDVTTGKLLALADIFTDKAAAQKIVEKHILDTITGDEYKDALMEDYESFVKDILTEDVFYLNEKGLVVICNPYMVTIYAAGTIEIEVPYEELKDVMNEKYILN